ncbi:tyrosine-type recombinase/integrase [Tsukamurella sp. USMM236]|uniref:tyrosine-type recombinase/integrase n=1 Tax=Tsukamurella sp. USMM236 TaxID=3081301 RepID=UPI003019E145
MIEKRGDGYRVRLYHRGRHLASRTFRRKRDAEVWERQQKDRLALGTWVAQDDLDATVNEWAELFDWTSGQPGTQAKRRGIWDKWVEPRWGRLPANQVAPSDVGVWISGIVAKRSPSTARQALGVLRQVLAIPVSDGVLSRNPAEGVKVPRTPRTEPAPLTHDQLWRLAGAMAGERDRLMILVAGYGGLRWGELSALRVSDLRNSAVRVSRAYSDVGGILHLGDVKDHEARTVPLPPSVARRLAKLAAQYADCSEQLLFPANNGNTPLRNKNWRRDKLTPAAETIGRTVTPHELRDTAASLAIDAGASVVAVARLLGHEDATTTLRHYAGLFPSDLTDIAKRLETKGRTARQRYELRTGDTPSVTRTPPNGEQLTIDDPQKTF